MIPLADLEVLKARFPLADVVGRRVQLRRRGRMHIGVCPFHQERTPSFQVYADHYHCFGCGAHGDVFNFLMQTERIGFGEALRHIASLAGAPRPRRPEPGNAPPLEAPRPPRAADTRALKLWNEALEIEGTLAATYLTGRRLVVPAGTSGRVLRFHPNCPWRDSPEQPVRFVPALIALFRDVRTDQPRAISRRGLTREGVKLGKPLALGPTGGCAIKLSADEDISHGLHVGEGVETVLAGMMKGFGPAWALGGGVRKFPALAGIESLSIFVDNDTNGVGQKAATECSNSWTAAGREVWRIVPDSLGDDMNDVVGSGP
jgi:hypothetical protein